MVLLLSEGDQFLHVARLVHIPEPSALLDHRFKPLNLSNRLRVPAIEQGVLLGQPGMLGLQGPHGVDVGLAHLTVHYNVTVKIKPGFIGSAGLAGWL
jgi:hypothetical protein